MDYWLIAARDDRLPHTPESTLWVFAERFDPDTPEYGVVHPVELGHRWLPRKLRGWAHTLLLARMRREMGLVLTISIKATVAADVAICGFTLKGEARARRLRRGWVSRWRTRLEKQGYENSRRIIAHSQAIANELITLYGLPADKITVAYPPVDQRVFCLTSNQARAALRTKFGMPENQAIFLFPSTGHDRKGLKTLIRLFGQMDLPVVLLIVGNAAPAKLPPNVRYAGYQRDMAALYQACDFTIMNSAYEPFGLVGVESVLCGTPVLMSTVTGCTEVLSEEACSTFEHDDDGDIRLAVERATTRFLAGTARLQAPLAHVQYACSFDGHLRALLALTEESAP